MKLLMPLALWQRQERVSATARLLELAQARVAAAARGEVHMRETILVNIRSSSKLSPIISTIT